MSLISSEAFFHILPTSVLNIVSGFILLNDWEGLGTSSQENCGTKCGFGTFWGHRN